MRSASSDCVDQKSSYHEVRSTCPVAYGQFGDRDIGGSLTVNHKDMSSCVYRGSCGLFWVVNTPPSGSVLMQFAFRGDIGRSMGIPFEASLHMRDS